jgi:hypothetical protein
MEERRAVALVDGSPRDVRRDPAGLRQVDRRVPPIDLGDPEGGDPQQRRHRRQPGQWPADLASLSASIRKYGYVFSGPKPVIALSALSPEAINSSPNL